MKKMLSAVALLSVAALGMFASVAIATNPHDNGHTPVSICHKPGTPAEQTLVVDDDSVQLTGHLGHGDTLGACQDDTETTPTETTPTETTPTETTPTEPTPTTPEETTPSPRCPEGMTPTAGKDGAEGNDECELPKEETPSTSPPTSTPEPPATNPSQPTSSPEKPVTQPSLPTTKPSLDTPQTSHGSNLKPDAAPTLTASSTVKSGTLPYTGLALNIVIAIGMMMVLAGLLLMERPVALVRFRSEVLSKLRK